MTKKITKAVANIHNGKQKVLTLGNMDAKRDWGFAKEYVEAMWLMLQQEKPEDFVIATGKTYTVRQFVEFAFEETGVEIQWKGTGADEKGYNKKNGACVVEIDPRYFRPAEVDLLWGDPTKAKEKLGWEAKTDVRELCRMMVRYDLKNENYGGVED